MPTTILTPLRMYVRTYFLSKHITTDRKIITLTHTHRSYDPNPNSIHSSYSEMVQLLCKLSTTLQI